MEPDAIIARLEQPTADRRPLLRELHERAPLPALVEALERAETPLTRQLLADALGYRGDPAALPALLARLEDPEPRVRAAAADAVGKLLMSEPPPPADEAGAALLARWHAEAEPSVRQLLASALGAARYGPALPVLRDAARSDDVALHRSAAWALEHMGA